jgi:hypothetical protein
MALVLCCKSSALLLLNVDGHVSTNAEGGFNAQAIGTRVLQRTTHLVDGVKDVNMTKEMFTRSILPIGVLFSGSLILSNTAYLYLSVSYIQMIKAFIPCSILLLQWTFRLKEPNRRLGGIVLMISTGVALASYGELNFNIVGFTIQALAVAFEASRLIMIEILLHGLKMDPLVSLHYYAPVCAVLNLFVLPFTEGLAPFYAIMSGEISPAVLLSNAVLAFALNVAAVFLVGVGSGLVLTLAGVLKVNVLYPEIYVLELTTCLIRIFSSSQAPSSSSALLSHRHKSSGTASLSRVSSFTGPWAASKPRSTPSINCIWLRTL